MKRDYLKEIIEADSEFLTDTEDAMWEVCATYEDYGALVAQLGNYYSGSAGFDGALSSFLANWINNYAADVANER